MKDILRTENIKLPIPGKKGSTTVEIKVVRTNRNHKGPPPPGFLSWEGWDEYADGLPKGKKIPFVG